MWILLITFASACNVTQALLTKTASSKAESGGVLQFNTLKVCAAFLFFLLVTLGKINFHFPTILFASGYGAVLFLSTLFGYLALKNGSMALTSLIVSYSVVVPCFFGVAFLKEELGFAKIIGIALLFVSMNLLKNQADSGKFSKRWIIYVAITFFSNGICSVIQKLHQTRYPGGYRSEFMICSLCVAFVLFFITSIWKKEVKCVTKTYSAFSGVFMGIANYLTLFLAAKVDATVLFPFSSVLTMLFNVTVSKIFFKEKFNATQIIGIVLGVLSVLLINLKL